MTHQSIFTKRHRLSFCYARKISAFIIWT